MHDRRRTRFAILTAGRYETTQQDKPALPGDLADTVANAIREDLGDGDVTASLIDEKARARAIVTCQESAVICGGPWFDEVFRQLDSGIEVDWLADEGDFVAADTLICELRGAARSLVTGERTALNFLQTLSGTATLVRLYAETVKGTACRILDTRKTLPGLRSAQKYAVRCGGAYNHRQGLYDAVLIKENHIAAAGSIGAAIEFARNSARNLPVQVEVENIDQLDEAIAAKADSVLLDNFDLSMLVTAVERKQSLASEIALEASGGFDLTNIRAAAETGVDYISAGALTKNVRAIDLSMRLSSPA